MIARTLVVAGLGAVLLVTTASAEVQTYFGFHVDITNAPPPPVVAFERAPRCEVVSNVYVADQEDYDCDVFRYGTFWYAASKGYWYRARSYRGPFVVVDARRVPRVIYSVPESRWKHHPHGGPPGRMTARGNGHHRHDSGRHGKGGAMASDR